MNVVYRHARRFRDVHQDAFFKMTTNEQVSPLILINHRGMRFVVTPEHKVLGRAPTADFIVDCTSVSRAHAKIGLEIQSTKRRVMIEDLGSLNGTFILDSRVTIGHAGVGDTVRFGNIPFIVHDANAMDDESTMSAQDNLSRPEIKLLSPAQQRVLYELLEGSSEKDVAAKLNLSPHTIHNHVREIYSRFSVHSRAELMAKYFSDKDGNDVAPI